MKPQSGKVRRAKVLYKKLKEAQKEERVARKHHDETVAQTISPDHDSADVYLLRRLDRASMELEVAKYRVQLIQGDLELESGVQIGSGSHSVPLEDELQALEEQLEKTLQAKEAAEDKLRTITAGKRTRWRESLDQRTSQQRSDSVDFTHANKMDPRSCVDVYAKRVQAHATASRKCIQRF